MLSLYPESKGKVVLLGCFDAKGPLEIGDPYGRPIGNSILLQSNRSVLRQSGEGADVDEQKHGAFSRRAQSFQEPMSSQPPKQTILHLSTTSGPGGAERVISSLSASLNAERRRVMVVLFRPGWLQTECERLGVETIIMPLSGPLHLGWFFDCLRLIRRERVALIHAHEFSAIVYGSD